MKINFTSHARKRLVQRKISIKQIEKALKKPDILAIESEDENKFASYKHINKYSLKVVYIENKKEKRIVTVYKLAKNRTQNIKNILINLSL